MGKFCCAIFKSSLFWVIMIALLCLSLHIGINVSFVYLWLFLIDELLLFSLITETYLFLKYFIIPILFFYNYFIIRKLLISWLFEWQFPFQIFSIYKERQTYLAFLKLHFRNFIRVIELLLRSNNKISKRETDDIESFLSLFEEELNIYEQLYNCVNSNNNTKRNLVKYKMSKCQIKYYNLLKSIDNILNENNTKNVFLNLKQNVNNIININLLFNDQNNLIQLNTLLKECLITISKYDWNNYTYMSPSYLYNLIFNDTFGSLSLYSIQFKNKIKEYQFEENFTPKGKVHYTLIIKKQSSINNTQIENSLISESNKKSDDGALLLFCLPNGGCYELIQKIKIDFYLKSGFSFLCWNYKGYGYSKGTANFSNVKSDVLELYDTIIKNPKYNFKKICVMGHSIGGVAACYLAKNRHVDLLISDRNFCDMPRLANNLYCGKCLSTLIKLLFIGKTDSIYNFCSFNNENINKNDIANLTFDKDEGKLYKNKINRIIVYSPVDTLILNDSTVKSGVARYIIKNYIIYKNKENNKVIKDQENFLDIVFNKNSKIRFINNFLELIHLHYDKKNSKNLNSTSLINLNINNDSNLQIGDLNPTKSEEHLLFSFFDKFFGVCCDNLNYVSNNKLSLRRETIFINNFFNNLLIWGAQGSSSKEEDFFEFHSYRGKKILKEAYNLLYEFNSKKSEGNINTTKITRLVALITEEIKNIIDVMDNLDIVLPENKSSKNILKEDKEINYNIQDKISLKEKLIDDNVEEKLEINTTSNSNIDINNNINNIDDFDKNKFYIKLNSIKGNIKLFKSYGGHNGLLKIDERDQFYKFLLSTGIIGN